MELPFNLEDVRLVCVDGNKVRFVLPNGHVEVVTDARKSATRLTHFSPTASRIEPKHIMFDDGIFGI